MVIVGCWCLGRPPTTKLGQAASTSPDPPPPAQVIKNKMLSGEDGRGRFKTMKDEPARIADRVKKAALKS
jgi:hypothetical protein